MSIVALDMWKDEFRELVRRVKCMHAPREAEADRHRCLVVSISAFSENVSNSIKTMCIGYLRLDKLHQRSDYTCVVRAHSEYVHVAVCHSMACET